MELKLNIEKRGLSTTEEVIKEEHTLNYGVVFRGRSAYEQAKDGGYQGSQEEFSRELAKVNRELIIDFDEARRLYYSGSTENDEFAAIFNTLVSHRNTPISVKADNKIFHNAHVTYHNQIGVGVFLVDVSCEGVEKSTIIGSTSGEGYSKVLISIQIKSNGQIGKAIKEISNIITGDNVADNLNTEDASQVLSAKQGFVLDNTKVGAVERDAETGDYVFYSNSGKSRSVQNERYEIGRIKTTETAIPITYAELVSLRNMGGLGVGIFYRITDYETTTSQSSTQSAKHPFDIIVQALDSNTLSENVQAIQREGDSYFAKANLNAWRLKYSLDNDKNRFAWAKDSARDQLWKCEWGVLESKANNDASTNYEQATPDGQSRYLYRPSEPTSYLVGKQFYREVEVSTITSTDGFRYEADSAPYYNEEDDYYDYPSEIRVKTASGSLVAIFTLEDYNTYYDEADYADMMEYPISFSDSYTEEDGVYYLVPESGIDSWWEGFIGGEKVETERVYYNGSVDSLYYAFGSILPKSSKSVTEVTDKIHIYKSDDIIDTVSYQSYVSPEDGGKGVVYWMRDEWNNECRYDFKNIQFKDGTSFYYTFGSTDQSLAGTSYENIIDVCNSKRLAVVIFKNRAIGNRFTSRSMQSAIFGNICERNVLDATSGTLTKITASDPLYSNYIGGNIGGTLTTQGQMTGCTIRGNNNGSIKGVFLYCDFFGRGSLALTDSNGNMKMARGIRVAFPVGSNANVKLTSDKTASSTTPVCENIELQASNFSTSQVVIPIDNYYGNTAMLKIAQNSSGVVKIWKDADLIQ